MKTNKEKIDLLFFEAFDFAQRTPVSEDIKYTDYAKNFTKSFNRLIKEIKDPEEQREIIDAHIKNDLCVSYAMALSNVHREFNPQMLNYEILKIQILDRIEIPHTKTNKDSKVNDFFPDFEPEQIGELQKTFSETRGIELACFIHQLHNEGKLKIIKNTKKSFKKFLMLFGNVPENEHEAVRKCFNSASTKGDFQLIKDSELERFNTKDKIKNALEVG